MKSKVVTTVNNFTFWRMPLLKEELGTTLKGDILKKKLEFVSIGGWRKFCLLKNVSGIPMWNF